jgi:hypothetical protein
MGFNAEEGFPMITRILLAISILLCPAAWSAQAYVHGSQGGLYGEFQLHVTLDPPPAEAGSPVWVNLTLTDPNGVEVTQLEPGSGLEVIMVRRELDVFTLLRPDMGEGLISMNLTFSEAGDYHVYVLFTPLGGEPVTVMSSLRVEGAASPPLPLEVHVPGRIVTETFGADVTLETGPSGLSIGLALITPDGEPLPDVAVSSADLVLISADGSELLHATPSPGETPNQVTFNAGSPTPGLYKAWALFPGSDDARELPFALEVPGF